MSRLENKTALVTGGAAGLGRCIAQRLALEGARVVITDVQSGAGELAAAQSGFGFLQHDVRDEEQWARVVDKVEAEFSHVDILVNNAGVLGPTDAVTPENTPLSSWRVVFSINVEGVFLGCRAVIPAMRRAGGGCIINIVSIAGLLATPHRTAYGASKAAVRQLTKSVAQYCAEERLNIRCNSVHPGNVWTALWDSDAENTARTRGIPVEVVRAEMKAQGSSASPLGEFVRPEAIAAAVAFLASEDAKYMTGVELVVDGGVTGCDTYHMGLRKGSTPAAE